MKMYQKPVMEIVELENVDVLTCSGCDNLGVHDPSSTLNYDTYRYYDGCSTLCPKDHNY